MKVQNNVLLINPPLMYIKDKLAQFGSLHLTEGVPYKTFNPGLLSIGTYLDGKGYNVSICDIITMEELQTKLDEAIKTEPAMIGISCSYGQAYLPTLEIARYIRGKLPNALIVVGGQHVSLLGGIVLKECEEIDIVSKYEGEITLELLLEYLQSKIAIENISGIVFRKIRISEEIFEKNDALVEFEFKNLGLNNNLITERYSEFIENVNYPEVVDLNKMPFIKYELYPDYLTYPPYVEESRGCAWGCKYCVSGVINRRHIRIKESKRFLDELEYCVNIFGKNRQYTILAATFGVDVENTIKICKGIIQRFGSLEWVSEFRVDLPWEKYIDYMYESGCRQFAVGLESSDYNILREMDKTRNCSKYMERAEALIKHVKQYDDTIMHLNIMFYAGENPKSVKTNLNFIMKWLDKIDSIHYSPLIAYPGTQVWNALQSLHQKYGTTVIKGGVWDKLHVYPINSSKYFSYEEAGYFSRIMEKIMLKEEGFIKMHETRFSQSEKGEIPEEYKEKFLQGILMS